MTRAVGEISQERGKEEEAGYGHSHMDMDARIGIAPPAFYRRHHTIPLFTASSSTAVRQVSSHAYAQVEEGEDEEFSLHL